MPVQSRAAQGAPDLLLLKVKLFTKRPVRIGIDPDGLLPVFVAGSFDCNEAQALLSLQLAGFGLDDLPSMLARSARTLYSSSSSVAASPWIDCSSSRCCWIASSDAVVSSARASGVIFLQAQPADHQPSVVPWTTRVTKIAQNARDTMMSRPGKIAGRASAAARLTTPRIPAHESTVG
jgi:hypothetical protein